MADFGQTFEDFPPGLIRSQQFDQSKIGPSIGSKIDRSNRQSKQSIQTGFAHTLAHFFHDDRQWKVIEELSDGFQRWDADVVPFWLHPFLPRIDVNDQPIRL